VSELFKFQKGIHTRVIVSNDDEDDVDLEIRYLNDVLEFYVNGKKVFSGDWTSNFMQVFTILLKELGKREA
jgi:hypothetical protein